MQQFHRRDSPWNWKPQHDQGIESFLQHSNWTNSINIFKLKGNKELGSFLQQIGWKNPILTIEFFSVAHNNLSSKTLARVAQFAMLKRIATRATIFFVENRYPKYVVQLCHHHQCQLQRTMKIMVASIICLKRAATRTTFLHVRFKVAWIMVLLVIGAILYINSYWWQAWFHFIEVSINNYYYFLVDNLSILSKFGFS